RETVVVDVRARRRAGEALAALHHDRILIEVGYAAAHRAPVADPLVVRVALVEEGIQRDRVARAGRENPGHAVGQAVRMAGPTTAPGIVRHLAARLERHNV